ncbi:Zinc finger, CCHC-type [Sesbania bispinosa]|nr:Zinc finger, CCHC-type [Sesbania bispinosa]
MDRNKQIVVPENTEADGEITVELESNGLDSFQLAKTSILSKVMADKPLNRNAVKNILIKAWGDPKNIQISDMGINTFLFTFTETRMVKDILQKGPWYVMGHIVSLQCWVPEVSLYEIDFGRTSFWVQLHGLPLDAFNTTNAAKIMSKFGEVMEVENPLVEGKLLKTFIRVRVLIDIKKAIATGCWVPRRDLPKLWIIFKYEKLQGVCFNCGLLGHEQRSCKEIKVMAAYNQSLPKYAPKLGVPPAKPLNIIIQEQKVWASKKKATMEVEEVIHSENEATQGTPIPDPGSGVTTKKFDVSDQPKGQEQTEVPGSVCTVSEGGDNIPHTDLMEAADIGPLRSTLSESVSKNATQKPDQNQVCGTQEISTAEQIGPQPSMAQYLDPVLKPLLDTQTICPELTLMDLKERRRRAGLGPDKLEDLDVHREFIGLKDPMVIVDYPSPEQGRHQGPILSEAEIRHCKAILTSNNHQNTTNLDHAQPTQIKQLSKEGVEYFVEFPSEDYELEDSNGRAVKSIPTAVENFLVQGLHATLSLKRTREDFSEEAEEQMGGTSRLGVERKRRQLEWTKTSGGPYLAPPSAMSWIIWNCRGLGAASTIRELQDLCKVYKPSLLFLSETKANSKKIEEDSLDIDVQAHSQNFIHAWVTDKRESHTWSTTFVYGNPRFNQRRNLWDRLQALLGRNDLPWICLGDFNEVLSQAEKVGSQPINNVGVNLFRQFLEDTGLMDLELKGSKYAWSSNPRNGFVTKEKLDRILANWSWRALFQHAMALAIPPISSDHSPLIFWPHPELKSGREFQYEAYWEEHEDCDRIIQEGWFGDSHENDPWEKYLKRTRNCKHALSAWHSKTFKRADEQLSTLKKELQDLQNRPEEEYEWAKIQEVKKKIDKLLKDDAGSWVEGQDEISKMVFQHFGRIYKFDSPVISQDYDVVLFLKAYAEEFYQVNRILNTFSTASGQKINLEKSGVIFRHALDQPTKDHLLQIVHMQEWSTPGRYLGLPAEWGRSKVNNLNWIKDKIILKFDGWKERLLNPAGKEVLIKSVLQAIPTYAMSILKFPKRICDQICSAVAKFWWKSSGSGRGMHWKRWQLLTRTRLASLSALPFNWQVCLPQSLTVILAQDCFSSRQLHNQAPGPPSSSFPVSNPRA